MQILRAISVFACLMASVQSAGADTPPEQPIIACMRHAADTLGFSGTAYVAKGESHWQQSFGFADAAGKVPNTTETRFNIGSATKMFTAFGIGLLVDQGALRFDDPLGKHLAGLSPEVAGITIAQLLEHTSGLGDYFQPENRVRIDRARNATELLPLALSDPPAFTPGTQRAYSNSGYVVLGAVIEKLSHMTYSEFIRRRILTSLNMSNTRLDSEGGATPMSGKSLTEKTDALQPAPGPTLASPAGGIFSDPNDLSRFLAEAIDGKLLRAATLAELLTPRKDPEGGPGTTGYGVLVREEPIRKIATGGGAPGVNADIVYLPASGWQIIALANRDPPVASQMAAVLQEAVLSSDPVSTCSEALTNPATLIPRMIMAPPAMRHPL